MISQQRENVKPFSRGWKKILIINRQQVITYQHVKHVNSLNKHCDKRGEKVLNVELNISQRVFKYKFSHIKMDNRDEFLLNYLFVFSMLLCTVYCMKNLFIYLLKIQYIKIYMYLSGIC